MYTTLGGSTASRMSFLCMKLDGGATASWRTKSTEYKNLPAAVEIPLSMVAAVVQEV